MSRKWCIVRFLALVHCCTICQSAAVCGIQHEDTKAALSETIDRVMAMRQTNWGWMFARTIVLLQVTAPKRLIAREKTIKKLEQDRMHMNTNGMQDLRYQALEVFAVQSLCLDPKSFVGTDLTQSINARLQGEFSNEGKSPKSGYDRFSIGIASLCATHYPISHSLVDKLLEGQNSDGSFGMKNPSVDTIMLLPALQCLRSMKNPSFNLTKVDLSVRRARKYIISLVKTNDMGEVYIGYKNLTALALAGLWFSKDLNEDTSAWKCQEAVKTIGLKPTPDDNEFQLGDRLLLLTGKGFLDVGKEDYACVETDPTPVGYHPTCNPQLPATCLPKSTSEST